MIFKLAAFRMNKKWSVCAVKFAYALVISILILPLWLSAWFMFLVSGYYDEGCYPGNGDQFADCLAQLNEVHSDIDFFDHFLLKKGFLRSKCVIGTNSRRYDWVVSPKWVEGIVTDGNTVTLIFDANGKIIRISNSPYYDIRTRSGSSPEGERVDAVTVC